MKKQKTGKGIRRVKSAGKPPAPGVVEASSGERLRVVFTADRIRKRVDELARQINLDLKGKTVHAIGVLENCFMFMPDLVRRLKVPVICHFLRAEMADGMSGNVAVREIVFRPRIDVKDKDVLLIDGIVQSGVTLDHFVRLMMQQGPSSIRTAMLVEKVDDLKVNVALDYVGFKTKAKFMVGYGLGFQERYRNLPYIASRA
jgi:hypoxanthine phosphoribosyltransferase